MLPQNDVPLLPWSAMIESMTPRDVLLDRAERRNASVFPENGSPLPASAMMASTASGASSQSPSGAGGTAEAKARVKSMTKLNSPVPADSAGRGVFADGGALVADDALVPVRRVLRRAEWIVAQRHPAARRDGVGRGDGGAVGRAGAGAGVGKDGRVGVGEGLVELVVVEVRTAGGVAAGGDVEAVTW